MKFETFRATRRHWVSGILLAIVGVVIARMIAPAYTDTARIVIAGVGRLVSVAGLVIIAVGVSRRVDKDHKEES